MPITHTLTLNVGRGLITNGYSFLQSISLVTNNNIQQDGIITKEGYLAQVSTGTSTTVTSLLTGQTPFYGFVVLSEIFDEGKGYTIQVPKGDVDRSITGFLHVGEVPGSINPNKIYGGLFLEQVYNRLEEAYNVLQDFNFVLDALGYLVQTTTGIVTSGGLVQVDETGPQLFNLNPSSGSVLNNPSTSISFDLIDSAGNDIKQSSIEFAINGTLVVDAGVDVTPSGFGNTTFVEVSPSFYQFLFIPDFSFDLGSTVTISGRAEDEAFTLSGNISYYDYSFRIWDELDIGGSISGSPDVEAPFLANLVPGDFDINVPVDSNVSLDIMDLHTGLDITSVNLLLQNILIVSGGVPTSLSYASTVISSISGGRGANYSINPISEFDFSDQIILNIYAEDQYTPPNILDTTYTFFTQTNSHLIASGFQIEVDSVYEDADIGESYLTTSSTPFVIDFVNTSGIPISTTGSYISLNGEVVSGTSFVSVTGNNAHYKVYFELEPDYTTDADLLFHVQQSGVVLGNEVYRDFSAKLLWGWNFCYDPGENWNYDYNVQSVVSVEDFGDFSSTTYLFNNFTTRPLYNTSLLGNIIGIDPPSLGISGSIISNNPYFEYGKTMEMRLEVSDLAGNTLVYEWEFTIEEEP